MKKDKYDRMTTRKLSEHIYRRLLAPQTPYYDFNVANDADRMLMEHELIERRFSVSCTRYRDDAGKLRFDCRVTRKNDRGIDKIGESLSKMHKGRAIAIAALRCFDNEG